MPALPSSVSSCPTFGFTCGEGGQVPANRWRPTSSLCCFLFRSLLEICRHVNVSRGSSQPMRSRRKCPTPILFMDHSQMLHMFSQSVYSRMEPSSLTRPSWALCPSLPHFSPLSFLHPGVISQINYLNPHSFPQTPLRGKPNWDLWFLVGFWSISFEQVDERLNSHCASSGANSV